MKRGAIVLVASRGACTGKPRPAVVVQSDLFNPTHASVTICLITSDIVDAPLFRVTLPPGRRTGLRQASQAMVDKIVSVPRGAVSEEVGECSEEELDSVADSLRRWMSLD